MNSSSTVPAWLPAATTAGGVVVGWALNHFSGQRARIRERQRDHAGQWREALVDIWLRARPRRTTEATLGTAGEDWYRAWLLYSGAVPEEVADRVEPLHLVLFMLRGYSDDETALEDFGLAYIVETAFRDALATLDAFIDGKRSLPKRAFPTGEEVMEIMVQADAEADAEADGLLRVREAINALPDPPRSRSRITQL